MKAWLAALLTDANNRADEMAVLTILGVLTFLGLSIYSVVVRGQTFDPSSYGTGLASALGAASIGMGLKARWDRDGDNH